MPFASVRDIEIYYEIHGQGPRLLYIGGTGGDLRQKPNIFDSPLAKDFEVLSFDQRGLGQTSKPDQPYTMADYAEDANGLLEKLGWNSCFACGISFGGMVAQELALRHPEPIKRLVLICTSSGGNGGCSYPLHELSVLSDDEYATKIVEITDLRCDAAWQKKEPAKFRQQKELALAKRLTNSRDEVIRISAQRQLASRIGFDTFDRLPTLKMPVKIAAGKYDGIAAPENQQALHQQIPDSDLEFFNGGHLFVLQDPSAFDRIRDFLIRVG